LALGKEIMPLVDRSYAGDRPTLMVENLVGDVRRNAETRHAGNAGSPQIMQTPSENT
jgi:hypothetical protein